MYIHTPRKSSQHVGRCRLFSHRMGMAPSAGPGNVGYHGNKTPPRMKLPDPARYVERDLGKQVTISPIELFSHIFQKKKSEIPIGTCQLKCM